MYKDFHLVKQIDNYLKSLNRKSWIKTGWVQISNSMLERLGVGNPMQNLFQIINGFIPKKEHKSKHKCFKK